MSQVRASSAPVATQSRAVVWTVRIVGAALLVAMAYIHLHLYVTGARHIAWIGPLFMVNVVLGFLAAIAVLIAPPRWFPWVSVLSGLLMIGTVFGLLLSLTVGLFGFHERWKGPLVLPSILVEVAGFLVLFGYGAMELMARRRAGGGWF
jgi:hypothetical protein